MYDGTWQDDDATGCDCADCRMYRVWESEGTDDWQPEPDGWTAWTGTANTSVPRAVVPDATMTESPRGS